jgi:hypothetical protein
MPFGRRTCCFLNRGSGSSSSRVRASAGRRSHCARSAKDTLCWTDSICSDSATILHSHCHLSGCVDLRMHLETYNSSCMSLANSPQPATIVRPRYTNALTAVVQTETRNAISANGILNRWVPLNLKFHDDLKFILSFSVSRRTFKEIDMTHHVTFDQALTASAFPPDPHPIPFHPQPDTSSSSVSHQPMGAHPPVQAPMMPQSFAPMPPGAPASGISFGYGNSMSFGY